MGARLCGEREEDVFRMECGRPVEGSANAPELLVIGMDGGRVQMVEKDPDGKSRWKEDKVLTVTTYVPGDGAERKPWPLVSTYRATMGDAGRFGKLAVLEARRRGLDRAREALLLGDCAGWIDGINEREFGGLHRVADWSHAEEYLHDFGRATHGSESPEGFALREELVGLLWEGRAEAVIARMREEAERLGPPGEDDPEDHPRRVAAGCIGYIERNRRHMDYPEYRRRGWPIGSGVVESGVKLFNKRVKGTEQFWQPEGVEPILELRALWLSQDERWNKHWAGRAAYVLKAA